VVDWVKDQPRMSRVAYGIALRAVAEKSEPYRQAVLAAATHLAEATSGVHTEEAKAIERMKRELKLV
jgi:light-regulated signal transduction histidine kinase (bacteriophytochrome)